MTAPHPRAFAERAHGEQTYGVAPYVRHLDAVAALVGDDPDLRAVAYLHDVLEDTSVSAEELAKAFGDTVAEAVALVTDPPGADRTARKAALHVQLRDLDERLLAARLALLVKVADRLANVRACLASSDKRLHTYRAEHPAFRAAAFRPGLSDALWSELDDLLA